MTEQEAKHVIEQQLKTVAVANPILQTAAVYIYTLKVVLETTALITMTMLLITAK